MAKKAKKKVSAKAAGTIKLGDPMKTFESIKDQVKVMEDDVRKFVDEGVKAAGRRARGAAQSVRKLCMVFRKEIQAQANAGKVKKAKKK